MSSFSSMIKKISAAFLLCLFLFIHIEKACHHHKQNSDTTRSGTVVRDGAGTCEICDFQAARDADLPIILMTSVPVKEVTAPLVVLSTHFISATIPDITGRGPPTQA